ncbi:hypothetical protein S101468_00325 [Acetobacter pasteurianus subsp. pasteurianus]|uniref:Uncharacterized protein n=1 Tax=Acetobacter pasteurianus subsp. pasteurianus TaxID=481145 RepID=A0AAC9WZV7_ACEPA|nr:hypothetical protein S101468_00325 [Acetobacter pasteurianus subsp. pasteurianus]
MVAKRLLAGVGFVLVAAVASGTVAHAQIQPQTPEPTQISPADAPVVTPSVDADVLYELNSAQGDAHTQQRMRWQVSSLRQRLDPQNSDVFMITSWTDHTLTVVDTARKRASVMPVPGPQQITPQGSPQRLAPMHDWGIPLWRVNSAHYGAQRMPMGTQQMHAIRQTACFCRLHSRGR